VEKYCYFFGQTDGSSEDGVEEINVIHGLPAITFFDFVCTCVNSIFLPLSYVFNCFKLGKMFVYTRNNQTIIYFVMLRYLRR